MKFLRLFLALLLACSAPAWAKPKGESDAPGTPTIDAASLAAAFAQNKSLADEQFRGQKIAVKGVVYELEPGSSVDGVLAYIYLQTAPGLPRVKVGLANVDNAIKSVGGKTEVAGSGSSYDATKRQVKIRINNGETLEAQESITSSHNVQYSDGYHYTRTSRAAGDWRPIVKRGDTVTVTGICKGQMMYVVIASASL